MRRTATIQAASLALALPLILGFAPEDPPKKEEGPARESKLVMTTAIACRTVDGYEDYEPLPDAALTSDEKLIVYYRLSGFETLREGRTYKAHLTQDGQIRRRGTKAIVHRKEKMLDYEPKSDRPLGEQYVKCIVSLKGLKPGEYDFEIILHDEIGKGPPATQTLKFKVIPAPAGPPKAKGESAQP